MQFDAAGAIIRRVRWYFTAPGALPLPYVSPFTSSNWGAVRGGQLGPGEVWYSSRPWSNGATPAWSKGQVIPCGSPDWWHNGTPSDAPPVHLIGDIPACCGLPGYQGSIGIKVGPTQSFPCYYQSDFTGARLTYWLGTLQPADQSIPGAALWYLPNFTHAIAYFEAYVSTGLAYCLSSQVRSQSVGVIDQDPVPFVGFYEGNPGILVFQAGPNWVPVPNATFIVYLKHLKLRGTVGVRVGLEATNLPTHYDGTVGAKLGLAVAPRVTLALGLGIKLGVAGAVVGLVVGDVGIKAGLAGRLSARTSASVGVKAGVASVVHHRYKASVGVKVSPTGQARRKVSATVGIKTSPTGTIYTGLVTPCCSGVVIPTSLVGRDGPGTAVTATYTGTPYVWHYTDPSSGFLINLQCVNPGSGFVWQLTPNVTAHCSVSHTLTSLVCHPFSIDISCAATGALCIEAGTYRFRVP